MGSAATSQHRGQRPQGGPVSTADSGSAPRTAAPLAPRTPLTTTGVWLIHPLMPPGDPDTLCSGALSMPRRHRKGLASQLFFPANPFQLPACIATYGRSGFPGKLRRVGSAIQDGLKKWYNLPEHAQNHRMVGIGRDLRGSSSLTPLLQQGQPEQLAQDHIQVGL